MFTAPFWHVELPRTTQQIAQFEEKLDATEQVIIDEITVLKDRYTTKTIAAEAFADLLLQKQDELKSLQEANAERLDAEIDKHRIFVWKNPRAFILGFGVRFPYVLFALLISLLVKWKSPQNRLIKNSLLFLQICAWGIATYLMIWVFWNSQDYSLKTYRYAFIAFSLLLGAACTFFIAYLGRFYDAMAEVEKLKEKVRYQFYQIVQLVANDSPKEDKVETLAHTIKKLDE